MIGAGLLFFSSVTHCCLKPSTACCKNTVAFRKKNKISATRWTSSLAWCVNPPTQTKYPRAIKNTSSRTSPRACESNQNVVNSEPRRILQPFFKICIEEENWKRPPFIMLWLCFSRCGKDAEDLVSSQSVCLQACLSLRPHTEDRNCFNPAVCLWVISDLTSQLLSNCDVRSETVKSIIYTTFHIVNQQTILKKIQTYFGIF